MNLNLLSLLKPTDVAKDSILLAAFTSPAALWASVDKTLVFGVLNLVILAYFRWRSLRLKQREIELRYSEEFLSLRARLGVYEDVAPFTLHAAEKPGRRKWLKILEGFSFRGRTLGGN